MAIERTFEAALVKAMRSLEQKPRPPGSWEATPSISPTTGACSRC